MGDQQSRQAIPMPAGNELAKRTPGAEGGNPPSTTSEPGYGGQQGQRQPEGGLRPGDDTRASDSAGPPSNDRLDEMADEQKHPAG